MRQLCSRFRYKLYSTSKVYRVVSRLQHQKQNLRGILVGSRRHWTPPCSNCHSRPEATCSGGKSQASQNALSLPAPPPHWSLWDESCDLKRVNNWLYIILCIYIILPAVFILKLTHWTYTLGTHVYITQRPTHRLHTCTYNIESILHGINWSLIEALIWLFWSCTLTHDTPNVCKVFRVQIHIVPVYQQSS